METKITLNYKYEGCEEYAPVDASFEIPGDVTITQLLYQVEYFLKACGYVFDGRLELVEETYPEYLDEIEEEEPAYGCMADFDKDVLDESEWNEDYKNECGCETTSSSLEKRNKDIKEEKEIREKVSTRADELKEMNEAWNKLDKEQKMKCYEEAIKEPEDKYPIDPLYKKVGTWLVLNKPSDSDNRSAETLNENC